MRRVILLATSAVVLAFIVVLFLYFVYGLHWPQAIGLLALVATAAFLVFACIAIFPGLLLRGSGLQDAEKAKAENDARGTLIQAVAGVALLVGAYVTWSQLAATQEQVSIATRQQVNDQFSRAVEQLGNESSQGVRIGGIYSLARLAQNNEEESYPVLDILASYVREHAPLTPARPKDAATLGSLRLRSPDVWTALIQITGLKRTGDATVLLDHSQLAGAELAGTRLSWITFSGSDLRNASFRRATVDHAFFNDADLRGTEFGEADLSGAVFSRTNLAGARLSIDVELRGARLTSTNVCGADLRGANLAATTEPIQVYADKKTQWPSGFDLSDATLRDQVELVTPNTREFLKSYGQEGLLEGCVSN
jgi:Pentapeptide repeats (9 copies)